MDVEEGYFVRIHKEAYAKAEAESKPVRQSIIDGEDIVTLLSQTPIMVTLVLCFLIV